MQTLKSRAALFNMHLISPTIYKTACITIWLMLGIAAEL